VTVRDLRRLPDLFDDEEAPVAVDDTLEGVEFMTGHDDGSRPLCADRFVFVRGDLERVGAVGDAALADEQVVAGLGLQTGQLRDVLSRS
jgi:hypothetical protein